MKMSRKNLVNLVVYCVCLIIVLIYIYYPRIIVKVDHRGDVLYPSIGLIIEFRSDPKLVSVVLNVIDNIPSDWPIQMFHGKDNFNFIQTSELSQYIKNNRIILTELESIKGQPMDFTTRLLTNSTFWKMVKGEKILLFQIDSIFCSNSPHKLKEYLKYDYIGAPWHPRLKIPAQVGNGGFSLRSRTKILQLLNLINFNGSYHEDVWFSRNLHLVNGTIAPLEIAKTFSVETIFYKTPLAVHKPIYLNWEEQKQLCQSCSQLKIIQSFCN